MSLPRHLPVLLLSLHSRSFRFLSQYHLPFVLLISSGCRNKIPLARVAYTTEINFLILLETERHGSGCQQIQFLVRALFLACGHCLLWALPRPLFCPCTGRRRGESNALHLFIEGIKPHLYDITQLLLPFIGLLSRCSHTES